MLTIEEKHLKNKSVELQLFSKDFPLKVIGKIRLSENLTGEAAYISHLSVLKKFRNSGYGDYLLKYAIQYCLNNESVSLYVGMHNSPAIRLYRKNGFFISMTNVKGHYLMTKKIC